MTKKVLFYSSFFFFWQELSPVQSSRVFVATLVARKNARGALELLPSAFSAVPTRRKSNERWLAYTLSVYFSL
jgi:hypothetical protein